MPTRNLGTQGEHQLRAVMTAKHMGAESALANDHAANTGAAPPSQEVSGAVRSDRRAGVPLPAALVLADLVAFGLAFAAFRVLDPSQHAFTLEDALLFAACVGIWTLGASANGLYRHDVEKAEHSTVEDVVPVFTLVTAMCWLLALGVAWIDGAPVDVPELAGLWLAATAFVLLARCCARALVRRRGSLQRAVIVGAGNVGQLVARKLVKHPEYGIELIGFVDADPRERRSDLDRLTILGPPERLSDVVRAHRADRVIFAFSRESNEETLNLVRSVQGLEVQVDVVPRLFDVLGPSTAIHSVEGLPLVALSAPKSSRAGALVKRSIDVVGAALILTVAAPLFAVIAWLIKRDSKGPVLFRQTRLTAGMRPFTTLKFRTMTTGVDENVHREYIKSTLGEPASPAGNGLYKLEQSSVVTSLGRWLRTTSLDELPQLLNVLRGDMSLVGPRPCIPYETEHFQPHHFERFRVRAGLTGLWQVTARAHASFAEALDMDVAYARNASLGLDLRLLCRTPVALVRQRGSTA
jgi:exopolysaccharide biosynthesis polyprenyl glycosylphosphotransferase